jgi:hypothetical protein
LFNLKDDPEELNNLASDARYADVQRELHSVLTSLIDPDKVTEPKSSFRISCPPCRG